MYNINWIKILLVAALALIILAGTGAAVSLSNSGGGTWKYQRDINIRENSGTALVDYQILIELKANDFPEEAQSSGADIRFTDANGKELSYWMEGWDLAAKIGMVWVKVPSIPADGDARIIMFYGNLNAKSSSNGESTFEFFDDFDGVSLDMKKWNDYDSKNYTISGEKLTLGPGLIGTIKTFLPPKIFEAKLALPRNNGWPGASVFFGGKVPGSDLNSYIVFGSEGPDHIIATSSQVTSSRFEIYVDASEHIYTIKWNAEEVIFQRSYSTVGTSRNNIPKVPLYIGFGKLPDNSNKDKLVVDWIRIRKYISSEPTIESSLFVKKSASSYSIKQSEETVVTIFIKNYLDTDITDITISDSMHPRFDLSTGDFLNQKKYDIIRSGESREIRYNIKAKKIGDFTLDPVTVTYADSEGNIQEMKSNPILIHVLAASKATPGLLIDQKSRNVSLSLQGEKTDVILGEDILLKLSAINLITKPLMHVQVILIPPSGMSVTSSSFSMVAAGQFAANYELQPGYGREIEVGIKSNQIGDFNVNGRIIYYFGDDKEKAEDQTLNLPIKVRNEGAPQQDQTQAPTPAPTTAGFEAIISMIGILLVSFLRKKW